MPFEKLLQVHEMLCSEAANIMARKNEDYSGVLNTDQGTDLDRFANFRACEALGICKAEEGVLIRMVDKLKRLISWSKRGELSVEDEGPRDAILDIINYAILIWAMQVERNPYSRDEVPDWAPDGE